MNQLIKKGQFSLRQRTRFNYCQTRPFSTEESDRVTGPKQGGAQILQGHKLNFGDVLIVPQKSFVFSRSKVNINTKYDFKFSPLTWEGTPLMSSNMDTVTNVQTAEILAN